MTQPDKRKLQALIDDAIRANNAVRSLAQAENYAVGESRKIGRHLINRETGETVRVVSVTIKSL